MMTLDRSACRGDPKVDSLTRVHTSLSHKEPDRLPLDIGGTRVSGIHIQAYRHFRESLELPPSEPKMQILYLQLPKVEEDFRSLLGVDLESVDPTTSAFERPVREVARADGGGRAYVDMWGCAMVHAGGRRILRPAWFSFGECRDGPGHRTISVAER